MKTSKPDKHQQRIAEARREVLHRLDRVRKSLDRETRWVPKGEKWLVPLMGLAVGVALAKKPATEAIAEPAEDAD